MELNFSINAKPQSNRRKKPSAAADDSPAIEFVTEFRSDEAPLSESQIKPIAPIPYKKLKPQSNRRKKPSAAADHSPAIEFVTEFRSDEPPPTESHIKPIAPIPNVGRPNRRLKNLPNIPQLFKSNGEDAVLQFELDSGSNEQSDTSTGYGLTLRQPPANGSHVPDGKYETISVMKLRISRKDSGNLPEVPGLDQFEDVPVEGFGATLFSAYGWKEGRGIGQNAKEDVTVAEDTKKRRREGLGFTETISDIKLRKWREDLGNLPDSPGLDQYEDVPVEGFGAALLSGCGWKQGRGISRNAKEDVTVAEVTWKKGRGGLGSTEEMPEPEIRNSANGQAGENPANATGREEKTKVRKRRVRNDIDIHKDKMERENLASKSGHERVEAKSERVDWLRNQIRVRIISEELKRGRLYLKKGVVVDVVGPGVCDVYIDETREFVQGVDQDFLEAALPKDGGPVLVLCGRHKGVYGNLLGRDSEKEAGVVRDADSHELLGVKLEQVAEYTGDPSDIVY